MTLRGWCIWLWGSLERHYFIRNGCGVCVERKRLASNQYAVESSFHVLTDLEGAEEGDSVLQRGWNNVQLQLIGYIGNTCNLKNLNLDLSILLTYQLSRLE